jgi:diguanylate cyclase (GGDEF)-like protein/PAS domain S-box-containing protein
VSRLAKYTIALSTLIIAAGAERAQAETSLQVGVYHNRPKVFINDEGEASGFFPELLNEIAERENWTLQYVSCQWEKCLSMLEAGKLDLMFDVAYSAQREKRFDFNQEVVLISRSFFFTSTGVTINSISDLDQKRVAVVDDSIQEQQLRDRAQQLGIEPIFLEFRNFQTLFQQLNAGKAEIGIANEFLGKRLAKQYSQVQRSDLLLSSSPLHFAVAEGKHAELLSTLDRHLVTLKDTPDSVYHQSLHYWLLGKATFSSELIAKILAAAFSLSATGIIAVILVSNRRLKKELVKRQQAEAHARKSEQQFKHLIDNVPGALFCYVIYPDGSDQVLNMSPLCEKLWEVKSSEVEESTKILWDMVHPDDITAIRDSLMRSAATLKPWFYEWRIITPSGNTKWLQGRGNPQKGSNGTVFCSLIIDVTEQKRIEQALLESEQKIQEITNAVPGAVYQYKRDQNQTQSFPFISQGISELYGFSPEQVMANPQLMWDVLDSEARSRLEELIQYSAATFSPCQYEFEVHLPNGDKKWVKGDSIPKPVEDGILWNGILVDITEQKWEEQLLEKQQQVLENLAKGETLDVILTELINLIEHQTQDLKGSFLLVVEERLWHYGESRLPSEYVEAINGLEIGEGIGSCGTAVARQEPVISANLETDPLWENYRELAQTHNLRACWSFPIFSSTREVLGTFALYSTVRRKPNSYEQEVIEIATKLAMLAIDCKQQEEALQKQAQQEQLLAQTIAQVRQSLDLQTILDSTVQELRRVFHVDRALIYGFGENSGEVLAEAVGEEWISLLVKKINDPCLQHIQYPPSSLPNPIQNITDIEQANLIPCYAQMLRESQVRANLVTPLFQDNQLWGFLIVQQCAHPRQWQKDEIRLLQKLSAQVAIAIQQAELYQEIQTQLTEREKLAEQLRHEAMHDGLTQLPNRNLLMDRLQHIFDLYQREEHRDHTFSFALLFLDLNGFKMINDTLGHDAGDQLLITVAERLKNCLRAIDTVGRLGGDEFLVIIEEISSQEDAIQVAHRIQKAFAPPAYLNGEEVKLSTSIGIVINHPQYRNPEQMMRDADQAMYEAKKNQLSYVLRSVG